MLQTTLQVSILENICYSSFEAGIGQHNYDITRIRVRLLFRGYFHILVDRNRDLKTDIL